MKTLLKLATAALISCASAAPALAAPPANLAVFSENGQPFSLVLDGRLLTRPVAPQVRVGWLAPGRHWADISVATPYGPPMRFRTAVWLQPGRETDYMLVVRRWGPQLEPVNGVPNSPGYGSGYYGGNQVQGGYSPATTPNGGYNAPYPNPNDGYNQGGYPAPAAPNGGYNPPSSPDPNGGYNPNSYPTPANPSGGYSPGSYPVPTNPTSNYPAPANGSGNHPAPAYLRPLSPADVAGLLQALQHTSFDAARLNIAKQALAQSSVRSEELAVLVKALSFSDARVELAEFGYAHVSDLQNFYRVYSSFDFSSDVQKVQQALGL
ncbi:MAG: DUF4476 domain-containing protein [Janthinobacterium lividum]